MPNVSVKIDSDYLIACARIRNVSVTGLVRELMETITEDQLIRAILDDEGRHIRKRYQHRYCVRRDRHAHADRTRRLQA